MCVLLPACVCKYSSSINPREARDFDDSMLLNVRLSVGWSRSASICKHATAMKMSDRLMLSAS